MGITQNKKRPAEASLFRIYEKTFLNALLIVMNNFLIDNNALYNPKNYATLMLPNVQHNNYCKL